MKPNYLQKLISALIMLIAGTFAALAQVKQVPFQTQGKYVLQIKGDSIPVSEEVIIDEPEHSMSTMSMTTQSSSEVTVEGSGYRPDFSQTSPSPNASALMRAVNNPTNLATGSISMQVSLCALAARGIQIPLTLNYQATGIQVGQKATSVGLGWRFSGGGQVTRVVQGFPDEQLANNNQKNQGWCRSWPFTDEKSVYEWYAYQYQSAYPGSIFLGSYYKHSGQLDQEPDIFYFEIPGKSGMFVFDHQGKALTIPYQNISIRWVDLSYFEIIDEDGTIYILGNSTASREVTKITFPTDNIRNASTETIECTTSWHLVSIESLTGDKVQFTYSSGSDIEYTNFSRKYTLKAHTQSSPGSFTETVESKDGTTKIIAPKYLSKITGPTAEITFGLQARSGKASLYSWVDIRYTNVPSSSVPVKRIALTYGSFVNGEPKLIKIDESVNGVTKNLYAFEYYNETSNFPNPYNYTTFIDFWGYWSSSASSSTLRPSINFFRTNNKKFVYTNLESLTSTHLARPRYSHFSNTGYSSQTADYILGDENTKPWHPLFNDEFYDEDFYFNESINGTPYYISGSNRSPNLNCTKTYVLKRISYPTGGYVNYDYELNEYTTHAHDTYRYGTFKAGGLRIKSVYQHDGTSGISTTYNYLRGIPVRDVRDEYFYTANYYPSNYCPDQKGFAHWEITASSKSLFSPTDMAGSHVIYTNVEQVNPDGSKSVLEFSSPEAADCICNDKGTYAILQTRYKIGGGASVNNYARTKGFIHGPGYQYEKPNFRHWLRGLLISEVVYDPSGNEVARTNYSYRVGKPKGSVLAYKPSTVYFCPVLFVYQYISQAILPDKVTATHKYNPKTESSYTYNSDYRPKEISMTTYGGGVSWDVGKEVLTKRIKYSNEYSSLSSYGYVGDAGGLRVLSDKKAVVPIEVLTLKNNIVIDAQLNTSRPFTRQDYSRTVVPSASYKLISNTGIPRSSFYDAYPGVEMSKNQNYTLVSRMEHYDAKANFIYATSPLSNDKAYVYGYNGTQIIAEVEIPRNRPPYTQQMEYISEEDYDIYNYNYTSPVFEITDGPQTVVLTLALKDVEAVEFWYGIVNYSTGTVDEPQAIDTSNGLDNISIELTLNEGANVIVLMHQPIQHTPSQQPRYDLTIAYPVNVPDTFTATRVFHTSFENSGEGTALAKAKTGIQAKYGSYTISLAEYEPGNYVLFYWKSTNNGTSWEKVTESLQITSGITSKTIGGSYYIDEVRLIPKGALIKTYTFRPDAGKTSETDHNGNTRYWEYDDFGRVVRMLDNERRVLEQYEYNIKN